MTDGVDHEKLRALAAESAGAHQWFSYLLGLQNRKRTTKKSSLEDFLRRNSSRDNPIAILRALEGAGCGEYQIRRRGGESFFEWRVDSQAAARVALGGDAAIGIVPIDADAEVPLPQGGPNDTDEAEYSERKWVNHRYSLRRDTQIDLNLPDDLTPSECERLGAWVRTLSFEGMS